MANDIKIGDLVMVIKPTPCCGNTKAVGMVLTVINSQLKPYAKCIFCGNFIKLVDEVKLSNNRVIERYRLIKIDPPALPEEITKDEEISA